MFRTTLDKLMAIRDEKKAEDGGFTLIELLVVVVIIGILIAIAIPLYLNYEKGSHDSAAESDLRSAITDVSQCYSSNNNTYPVSAAPVSSQEVYTMSGSGSSAVTCSTKSNLSTGTNMTYAADGTTGFALASRNTQGSTNEYFWYDSTGTYGNGVQSGTSLPTNFPATAP